MNLTTPANGQFMVAAYLIAAVVYLGYAVLLWRRQRELDRRWGNVRPANIRPADPTPPDVAA